MVGPVGLPTKTKRWTVLKSVFKYKKFQESFEMIIYNQKLTVDADKETADKFLKYAKGTHLVMRLSWAALTRYIRIYVAWRGYESH